MLNIRAGNGIYTKIFWFSINFSAMSVSPSKSGVLLQELFPSCPDCLRRREQMEEIDPSSKGECCADWDMLCPGLLLHTKPPSTYPKLAVPGSGSIAPLAMTSKQLRECCILTYEKLCEKEWKNSAATAYMQQQGLNAIAIETNIENATRYMRKLELESQSLVCNKLKQELKH